MLISISLYFQWYHDNITNVYVIFVRFTGELIIVKNLIIP